MKLRTKAFFLGLIALSLLLGRANADELFSYTNITSGGVASTSQLFFLSVYITTEVPWGRITLLNVPWTTNDVGATLTATTATHSNFDEFVERMTNGVQNYVYFQALSDAGGSANGITEAAAYFGNPLDPRIDLQGYQIDSISLKLNALSINTPGANPNGDGNWTDYMYSLTLSADGFAIPEPATWSLLVLGIAVLFGGRRCIAGQVRRSL